ERDAELLLARPRQDALAELVVNFFFHKQPRAGATALALVEEQPEERAFHGPGEVRVGQDDVRTLAPEFQRDALEIAAARGLHDQLADYGRAGEGHLVH